MLTSKLRTTRPAASRSIAALLVCAGALALAGPAAALRPPDHIGDPGTIQPPPPPPPSPPTALFSLSPNPAVVPESFARPVGGVNQVKAAALRIDGVKVAFDASRSAGKDGHQIVKYDWDLDGNGSFETSSTTSAAQERTYTQTGQLTIKLRVTDDAGRTDTVTHVLVLHRAPHAALKTSKTVLLPGEQVTLDGSASSDDGSIQRYEWDLDGDGTFERDGGTTPSISTTYAALGTRSVRLRVTDDRGATGVANVQLRVHRAPTAAFVVAPSPAIVGEQVKLDGSSSNDDGTIARYEWDLDGNGTFETDGGSSPTTTTRFASPATVLLKLRVTDADGAQSETAMSLRVLEASVVNTTADAADAVAPRVGITSRVVRMTRRGVVALRITCPVTERGCATRLSLRSAARGARSARLGNGLVELGGGQTATVRIKLARSAKALVRRNGKLRARAIAVATDRAGNVGTSSARVTIKAPARR